MSIEAGIIIWCAIVIVTAVIVSYLTHRWGRDPFGWVLLSAAMGPIALIGLAGAHSRDRERATSTSASTSLNGPIVVACDGSEAGERLATRALATRQHGNEVVLLAVMPYEAEERTDDARNQAREMTALAEDALERAGIAARVEVRYGPPGEAIVRYADDVGASLIVIGRRGSGLTRSLLGSVSSHVAQHARAPVELVP